MLSLVVALLALLSSATGCGSAEDGADRDQPNRKDAGDVADGGGIDRDAASADAATDGGTDVLTTCETVQCNEHASCDDSSGKAVCDCNRGFLGDGTTCDDADECDHPAQSQCDDNASCKNTEGGFTCACKAGFVGDGKTCTKADACALAPCGVDSTCMNTATAFECICNAGFTKSGEDCVDIDECAGGTPLLDCSTTASSTCTNTPGSAYCKCDVGFHRDGDNCVANDACTVGGAECDATHASCIAGDCVCDAGYDGAGGPGECNPVDECDMGLDNCSSAAICADADPGFTCTCRAGFDDNSVTGTGIVCEDTNECTKDTDNCVSSATCTNTTGSFSCTCPSGYGGDGTTDGSGCTPINECSFPSLNDCHVNADCSDKTPGFTCKCKSGFTGDGKTHCDDIDECANSTLNDCSGGETCMNNAGGYECGCKSPYIKDGDACYCDLAGYWAVRQDVTTTWPALLGAFNVVVLKAGSYRTTVWELHRMRYDGTTVKVDKKGCGPAGTPDLLAGPFIGSGNETYGTYIPTATWNAFGLLKGADVPLVEAKPGSSFTSPKEAIVIGAKLTNPLTDTWPTTFTANMRDDADGDGVDGLMVWSRTPSTETHASTTANKRYYSYAPVSTQYRATCVASATRLINHLEGTVESCTRITGSVKRDKAPGQSTAAVEQHVYDCRRAQNTASDYGCSKAQWDAQGATASNKCSQAEIDALNNQADVQTVTSTFEMVKLSGNPDAAVPTCQAVKTALPAY